MKPPEQKERMVWIRRWAPAFVMMVLIFTASSIPSAYMPSFGPYDLSVKKLGHATGYVLLAYAYTRAIGKERKSAAWIALGMAVIYAFSDELHQSLVPGRSPSLRDVGIDSIGALLGSLPGMFRRQG